MSFRICVQHPRVALGVVLHVACLFLVASAVAQQPVLHDGSPALKFAVEQGRTFTVDLVDRDSEKTLRLRVEHNQMSLCTGYLYISHSRISYDPVETPNQKDAFGLQRSEIKKALISQFAITHKPTVGVWTDKKNYFFMLLFDREAGTKTDRYQIIHERVSDQRVYDFIGRSLNEFDTVLREAEQLTANLGQQPQTSQPAQPSNAGPAEVASNAPPATLVEGQSPEEVEKSLGKPEDTITVKDSVVYVYPRVKVFFEKGKLVNVEERKKTER